MFVLSDVGLMLLSEVMVMVMELRMGLKVSAAMMSGDKVFAFAGRGVRVKCIVGLSVKVYVCGFYVDVDGVCDGDVVLYECLV